MGRPDAVHRPGHPPGDRRSVLYRGTDGGLFPLAKIQADSKLADVLMGELAKLPDVMNLPLYEELPGGKLARKEE